MTKMHDFTNLATNVIAKMQASVALEKVSRTTRTSRTGLDKPLSHSANFGTSHPHRSVRLQNESYQLSVASRTVIDESNHRLGNVGTTGTSGTSHFQHGRMPTLAPGNVAEWHAILDELTALDPPEWASPVRWQNMVFDADAFLTRWADAADQLGWTTLDLFGVHPNAPADRYDVMGLLLLIQGGTVVALTTSAAIVRRPSQSILTYRRPNAAGGVIVTEVAR